MKKLDYTHTTWKDRAKHNAKIIDELLVLFDLFEKDLNIIDDALEAVAETRKKDSSQPVTVGLFKLLVKKHYLKEDN